MSPFNACGDLHPSTRMMAIGMAVVAALVAILKLADRNSHPSVVLVAIAMCSPFIYFGYRLGVMGTMPRWLMNLSLVQADLLGDKQASRDLRKKLEA